jgi:hypothetical protein
MESEANTMVEKPLAVLPLYAIAVVILIIGILPFLFSGTLLKIIGLFQVNTETIYIDFLNETLDNLTIIGVYSMLFILLGIFIFFIRKSIMQQHLSQTDTTWICGYVGETTKTQYSASSFIRTYRKLAEPVLSIKKEKNVADGIYPDVIEQITHPYDKLERVLIDKPIYAFRWLLNRFVFLQNGNLQYYILYGFVFVTAAILLPFFISKIMVIINFLNQQ